MTAEEYGAGLVITAAAVEAARESVLP